MSDGGVSRRRVLRGASADWGPVAASVASDPMSVRDLASLFALVCGMLLVLMAT
jgi:hypothetical protein